MFRMHSATLAITVAATTILGCAAQNPIPDGQPIPGTDIVSCGDDLLAADPAGALEPMVDASGSTSLLGGTIVLQASCPHDESNAQTEFIFDHVTLYRDDAGEPGAMLGTTEANVRGIVSCGDRVTTQIGGASKSQAIDPVGVTDLKGLCAERAAMPTGSPLYVQVEITGHATTCSTTMSSLLFRSKSFVTCPSP